MVSRADVMEVLKKVYDPEIGLSIVDLGLVYEVKVDGGEVYVKMTLTAPGCPLHSMIRQNVINSLGQLRGVENVQVDLVFNPPWNPGMMSEKAKKLFGYAEHVEG